MWVITGDKQATAINIGYSSKLLSSEMRVVKINAETVEECRRLLRREVRRLKGKDYVFPEDKKKTTVAKGIESEDRSVYSEIGEADATEDIEDTEEDFTATEGSSAPQLVPLSLAHPPPQKPNFSFARFLTHVPNCYRWLV